MAFCVYLVRTLAGFLPYAALRVIRALAFFRPGLTRTRKTIDFEIRATNDKSRQSITTEGTFFDSPTQSPSSNKKQDKMSTFEQVVSLTSDPIYPIFRHSRSKQIHCDDRIPKYMGTNRAERMEADGAYCRSPSMARAISSVVSPRPLLSSSSRDRRSLSFAARPSTSLESSSALSVRCTQTHSTDECEEGAGSLENRIQKRKGHAKACVCSNIPRLEYSRIDS